MLLQQVILRCTPAWVGSGAAMPKQGVSEASQCQLVQKEKDGCKVAMHLEQVQAIHFSGSKKRQLSQGLGQAANTVINRT